MKKIDTSNERGRDISDRENVNDWVHKGEEKEEGERDIWSENF